jgi:hypothetical protein
MVKFTLTESTRQNLKFIRDIPNFISDKTEEFIVHVTLLEGIDEFIVVQFENY